MEGLGFTIVVLLVVFLSWMSFSYVVTNKGMTEMIRKYVPWIPIPYCSRAPLVALCEMDFSDRGVLADLINEGEDMVIYWGEEPTTEELNVLCNAGLDGRIRGLYMGGSAKVPLQRECGIAVRDYNGGGILVVGRDFVAEEVNGKVLYTKCDDVVSKARREVGG